MLYARTPARRRSREVVAAHTVSLTLLINGETVAVARVTVTELKQYIQDLEVGLTLRLDDLDTRLASIETDLAIIKEHLVTQMRAAENVPGLDAQAQ